MKTRALVFALALAAPILMISCQPKKTEAKKVVTADATSADAARIKEEIVQIVKSLPTNTETVNLINSTGTAYLAGFTGENLKTENLLTRADKAKAYGTIIFDLAYTHTYNQTEQFSKLVKVYESLTKELGFEELVQSQKQFKDRYQNNKDNKDSLDVLVSDMLKTTNDILQKTGSSSDLSLVAAGAIVKSLNVISYLTLFSPGQDKLIEVLKKQKDVINAACEILKKSPADQEVAKLYAAIVPVNDLFNSSEPFSAATVDKINKLTDFISL